MYSNSNETGVYIIRCKINNFIYIGSASGIKGFRKRATFHRWTLNHGKHHSPILQNHFNKYGIDAFTFEIALVCPSEKCLDFEQVFLDANGVGYHNKSYNINPSAICLYPGKRNGVSKLKGRKASVETRQRISIALTGIKRSEEVKRIASEARIGIKRSPEAVAKTAAKLRGIKRPPGLMENLRKFNVDNPLSPEIRKKIAQTATEANSKDYIVTSPDGEDIDVKNLSAFCRHHNLTSTHMIDCAKGRYLSHAGWQCRYAHVTKEEQEIAIAALKLKFGIKEYIVTTPTGAEITVENLYEFCIKEGLSFSAIWSVWNGKKRHYKGWMCHLVDEPEEIRIKRLALRGKAKDYIVTTPQGEELAVTNIFKFSKETGLDHSGLIRVARGKRSHYKGYLCRYA
ncbi:MAG: GIY-YIG nuclease family protein [Nostoc sp.]|uniref:GIY-YIG nuclease family protein n=1 Tax=Nostoc sp. TaxID=1180 RepID=UPI002FF6E5D1